MADIIAKDPGNIYFGYDGSNRYFKIGKSRDPKRREKEIQHMNPTFRILFSARVPDQTGFERTFHQMFADRRVVGEWFDLSARDVAEATNGMLTVERVNVLTGRWKIGRPFCPECGDVMEKQYDNTCYKDTFYFCARCNDAYLIDERTEAIYKSEEGEK